MLGLYPLYVANEGIFVAIVNSGIAESFTETLRDLENGKNATVIGEVVEGHPKQVVATSSIGGKRMVSMLTGELLPRIC